ncbi:CD225/dispanin family protein [Nocardiopsis rhodophaea]|uniref:CD225/dispanin family protein n=1 Tax=Nocardiopsis rhodophaea TaxID=280238 RepID=UPI0039F11979
MPPSNWLVPAILTLFCCWPAAIPAIVFASQVNSKWNVGDYAGAQESAGKAKMWTLIALGAGIAWSIIVFSAFAFLGSLEATSSTPGTYDTGGF